MIYEKEAMKYKPDKIKYLFIAEAPPDADIEKGEEFRYFYFDNEAFKFDYLFKNIVEILFSVKYDKIDKKDLLVRLKSKGFFLIDAIHTPIKRGLSDKKRAELINDDFPYLLEKLKKLTDKDTKIILIKKVVYNELNGRLRKLGFSIINTEMLDFPSHGNQTKFKVKFRNLMEKEKYGEREVNDKK